MDAHFFWSFLSKNIHFWGVIILFFIFDGTKLGSGSGFFFFFSWQNFSHLVTKKGIFLETIPKARNILRKKKLK
jgi:hypothetical protein